MRILFMGTPDFAVASLRRLVEDGHEICGVFTQPDKPKNRGHKLAFSPVKEYALSQGLTVYQPADAGTGWVNRLTDSTMALRTPTAALDISSTISIRRIKPHPAQFSFWRAMESRPRASWLSTSV